MTDIHMPGPMTGLDFARYAREHWPSITVLVASGRAVPARGDAPADTRFLLKPYSLEDVVTTIHELISQRLMRLGRGQRATYRRPPTQLCWQASIVAFSLRRGSAD